MKYTYFIIYLLRNIDSIPQKTLSVESIKKPVIIF